MNMQERMAMVDKHMKDEHFARPLGQWTHDPKEPTVAYRTYVGGHNVKVVKLSAALTSLFVHDSSMDLPLHDSVE